MIGRVSDIDLRLLRVFVAVVEAGGFSLAVARLNVAESTVSQHMSDLEGRLGFRLCERGRSGFRLTSHGRRVYALALELLDQVERFRDQVGSIGNGLAGTLRLGLPDGIITERSYDFGAALGAFLRAYPDMRLEINMRSPRVLERSVHEGELDVAIGPEHRRIPGLAFSALMAERNYLYCGSHSPLFAQMPERARAEAVEAAQRIARGYLDRFDAQFFPRPSYRVTVHQIEAAAMLILSTPCIGFLPDHFAAPWVARDEMRAVRPDHYTFTSRMGLILRPDRRDDPAVQAFTQVMTQRAGPETGIAAQT